MLLALLALYAIIAIGILMFGWWAADRERTAHGHIVILQLAVPVAAFWPFVLAYYVLLGIVVGARTIWSRLARRFGRAE